MPPGDVVITTKEMFDEVRATHDAVKELSGDVSALRNDFKGSQKDQAQKNVDFETRIRSIERRVYLALGAGGVLGAAAGALVDVLIK